VAAVVAAERRPAQLGSRIVSDPQVPTGVATGVGSLPGTDIDRAVSMVFSELPDLPHLPELPERGPAAGMVGRTATLLAGLPVDLQPAGWRLVDRAGLDERRGRDLIAGDLDALVPALGAGYDGALKLQLAGPWTLAANVELPRGGRALADRGAVRDLVSSLAETVHEHLAEVARRAPQAKLVLQLDEPSLPQVLGGGVATESGYGTLRAPEPPDVTAALREVVAAAADVPVVVHCCGPHAPLRLMAASGAAVSIDAVTTTVALDALGELVEAGSVVWLGVLPTSGPGAAPAPREVADRARRLWRDLGFAPDLLPSRVAVTPACGLAGASEGWAHTAYRLLRQAARALAEAPEGTAT
jgi:hypothetical protein